MGQRRGSSEPWRRPVEDVAPEKHPGSVVFGDGIPHTEIGLRCCTASPAAAATPAPTARLIPGTPSGLVGDLGSGIPRSGTPTRSRCRPCPTPTSCTATRTPSRSRQPTVGRQPRRRGDRGRPTPPARHPLRLRRPGSRRLSGIEPIPLAQLGRPRIDVTIRIRDFFRDACPHVVTMLDDASLSSLPGLLVLRVVSSFTSVVGGARMRHGVVYCASGSR